MLKSIPNFVARTQTVLASAATVVEIDQAGADLLRDKLAAGDWVYARLPPIHASGLKGMR